MSVLCPVHRERAGRELPPASAPGAILATVRGSKNDQQGRDFVRRPKTGCASAVLHLRNSRPAPDVEGNEPVFRGLKAASIGRWFSRRT